MIYDCFSFFNELDILEIRLNILKDVVDRFVLVEAPWRHSGVSKPLYFVEHRERFAPFLDKIVHVVVDDVPIPPKDCPKLITAWAYENHQRNAIMNGLKGIKDDDTLLISDLDEIPDPELVKKFASTPGVGVFKQKACYYYLNFVNLCLPHWYGTKILTWKTFRDASLYMNMPKMIVMPEFENVGPTPTRVRFLKASHVYSGGWHFSYYGGAEQIKLKLRSIADHVCDASSDVSVETIRERVRKGMDPMGRGERFCPVPLDASFPQYILENQKKYADGIVPCSRISLKNRILMVVLPLKRKIVDSFVAHMPAWMKPLVYFVYSHCARNPIPLIKDQLAKK